MQHMQLMLAQTAQSALCSAMHTGQARLCRWLLQARLVTGRDDLSLTHEFLGEMLGTQRASVTLALGKIEATGAIRARRGGVEILDAARLGSLECGCFRALRGRYHDLAEGFTRAGQAA